MATASARRYVVANEIPVPFSGQHVTERLDCFAILLDTAPMKRILVLYYSQSGDVKRVAQTLVEPLQGAGVEVPWAEIIPQAEYPSPWRNVHRFFNEMPECVLGYPPEIAPPSFSPDESFDLVILAYQVWFLSPSPPIQAFFRTEHARVLRGRKVLTLTVCRNMWHEASLKMRALLAAAGAVHVDNLVVTHQGPAWATFITTTRTLFTGKRDRLWGVLPPAGIAANELERVRLLGAAMAQRLDRLDDPNGPSLLRGLGAVEVNRRYVIAERVAAGVFPFWARVIRLFGRVGRPLRHVGIFLFIHFLLLMIVVGIPLTIITLPLVYPFVRGRMAEYVARLKQPTEA